MQLIEEQRRLVTKQMASFIREVGDTEVMSRFGRVSAQLKDSFEGTEEAVTEADLEASRKLLEFMRRDFPGSYSEEEISPERWKHNLVWQVDPVDGTDEFCRGNERGFAITAALLEGNSPNAYRPVAGIIHLPALDRTWYGTEAGDLHYLLGEQECRLPDLDRTTLRAYVRASDPNDTVLDAYKKLAQKLSLDLEIVEGGGAGSAIAGLLDGSINLVVLNYNYSKEWDLSTAEVLVRNRGGFVCDLAGNEFTYNREDPLNRNGFVLSCVFKKEEILNQQSPGILVDRLKCE